MSDDGTRIYINGEDVTNEINASLETDDPLEPLDNGKPGFRLTGLKDVQGTFSAPLSEGVAALLGEPTDIQMLYFYGPDPNLHWWQHWFYRVRERLVGTPYPTVIRASGPARLTFDKEEVDGDDVVISGTFESTGHWDFK